MQPTKPGSLGKGLDSLMGGLPKNIGCAATLSSTGFMRLSPDRVQLSPDQHADGNALPASFLNSVREHGILQPLIVRKIDDNYVVIAGARRLVAARSLGIADVPVIVIQATDDQASLISRAENEERTHPGPVIVEPQPATAMPASTLPASSPWRFAGGAAAAIALLLAGIGCGWLISNLQDTGSATPVISTSDNRSQPLPLQPPPVISPVVPEQPPVIAPEEFQQFTTEQLVVDKVGASLRIVIQSPLFSYRTNLDEGQLALLKELGAIFASHEGEYTILITGHTDATPIRGSSVYRDNHELGLARASEVARFLWRQAGVPVGMLRTATAGSENPPFQSDTPESAKRNRTATILITPNRAP
jgi:flagellar motor protein MotB